MPKLSTPEPARHSHPTVKARRLAYLIWDRPDRGRADAVLTALGLQVAERTPASLYLRGTAAAAFCYVVRKAPRTRCVGFALEIASREDLERVAMSVSGAGPIEALDGPGGGEVVRLTDPSGFRVDAVHGQQPYPSTPRRAPLARFNTADKSPRVNDTQRVQVGVPEVVKLGHVVIEIADFYTRHFGFIPSDVQVLPDGSPVVACMRLDLGEVPADHHTLALAQGLIAPPTATARSSLSTPTPSAWGSASCASRAPATPVGHGRHILGSQIFDYWQDPWGDKHEHYSDGDVFTAAVPTGCHEVSREALAQWGPPLPRNFTRPKLGIEMLAAHARNLRRSPDLSLRKVIQLARLFGRPPKRACRHHYYTYRGHHMPINVVHYEHQGRGAWGRTVRDSYHAGDGRIPDDRRVHHREQCRGARIAAWERDRALRRAAPCAGNPQPAVHLPGCELPAAHDRVRHGPGRQALQHDLLVFGPAETLTELSGVQDFAPGDRIGTGTPAGCARSIPSPLVLRIVTFMGEKFRWRMFSEVQAKRSQYLKGGDIVEDRIRTGDGVVDLGLQRNRVVEEVS